MRISLKAKLLLVAAAAIVTIVLLAFGAISSTSTFADVLRRSNAATVALRNHTVADMMHDAIRADVYRALFASTNAPETKATIAADAAEHAASLRQLTAANSEMSLPPEIKAALSNVAQPLENYVSGAVRLVDSVFIDARKAEALLPEFDKQFSALEYAMDDVGDKIEAYAKSEAADAEAFATLAGRLSKMGLLFGFLVCAGAVYIIRREVLAPLSTMIGAMNTLANGSSDIALPQLMAFETSRSDELGEMARSVEVFRKNAVARNALTRESRILSDLNEWLQSAKSETELYQMIATFVSRMLPACTGSLYIYANSRDILECVKVWNGTQSTGTMHPDDCWGLRRGRTYTHGQNEIEFDCGHVHTDAGADYCCIPILAHGETVGLLHLEFAPGRAQDIAAVQSSFAEERRLGLAAAEHISLAIANVKLREQLRDQSIRDVLTGLFNRRYMLETCRREFQRAARAGQFVSVLSIDVDHFKTFNDNHGHDAGDCVLRCVGETLRSTFRDDDVPCRFGGEEFVVLLPGASPSIAAKRAEELRAKIEALTVRYAEGALPKVTISVGVASFPKSGVAPMEVLKVADEALYVAKNEGRNCVRLSPGCMDSEVAVQAEAQTRASALAQPESEAKSEPSSEPASQSEPASEFASKPVSEAKPQVCSSLACEPASQSASHNCADRTCEHRTKFLEAAE